MNRIVPTPRSTARPAWPFVALLTVVAGCGGGATTDAAAGAVDLAFSSDAGAGVAVDLAAILDGSVGDAAPDGGAAADLAMPDLAMNGLALGEDCASAITLARGAGTYAFGARRLDRLTGALLNGAGCTPTAVLSGPDIAFKYVPGSSGKLLVTIDATSDFAGGLFRVAGLITEACEAPVIDGMAACASAYAEMPSVTISHPAVAGRTYYVWVAKTDSSPNTFAGSQVKIMVTELP